LDLFQGYDKVELVKLTLISLASNKAVDIKAVATNIDIFSSIFSPTTTGIIDITDASGSVYNLTLVGEEGVEMEFKTPGRASFKRTFHAFRIEEQEYSTNGSCIKFRIHLASVDHYPAVVTSLNKGFKGLVSDMMKSLLTTDLQTPRSLNIETTKGLDSFIIPNWNILEIIEFMRQRANSEKYVTPFLFFEDQSGYNFVSYEKLVEQRLENAKNLVFTFENLTPDAGEENQTTVPYRQYRNAVECTVVERPNAIKKVIGGGMSSTMTLIDLNNKTETTEIVDYTLLKNKIKQKLNDSDIISHSDNFVKKYPKATTNFITVVGDTDHIQKSLTIKKTFINKFKDICLRMVVNGDSELQPGDVIYYQGPSRSFNESKDIQLSGNYIIGDMKHNIQQFLC